MHLATTLIHDDDFIILDGIADGPVNLKIEGLNPSGSIKMKTALSMIESAEKMGKINPDTILIESSSGNLGCALASAATARGLRFVCVVDPNALPQSIKIMRALGAELVCVTERDSNGGYLGSRISYVKQALASDPHLLWLNQYANEANAAAHEATTAPAIMRAFPQLDFLFVGAGTTGTLMGCLRYFSRESPRTKIVAVDSFGSVTFGTPPASRFIPGLGSSRVPEIFDASLVKIVEHVSEIDAVAMCRWIAHTKGLLVGGSTGTVLAAVRAWRRRIPEDSVVVAISPDMGERYLDTVYDDDWVGKKFGAKANHIALSRLNSSAGEESLHSAVNLQAQTGTVR